MTRVLRGGPIVAVLLFLVTGALMLSTFGLAFADLGGAFSPVFFPRIVLMALAALTAVNIFAEIARDGTAAPLRALPVFVLVCGLPIYVLAIEPLGFFLASVPMGAAMLLALGLRDPLRVVGAPVLGAGALVALFNHALTMPLPTSPFTWWF